MGVRVVVILLLGVLGCLVALRKPFWGLCLVAFLYFFRPDLWGAEAWLKPVLWMTGATFFGWLISGETEKNLHGAKWIVVILTLMLISTVAGPYCDDKSWARLWMITKIFVFVFLLIKLCNTSKRLAIFVITMLAGCLWMSKTILIPWAAAGFSGDVRIDTCVGQGGGANYVAFVFAATLPFLILGAIRMSGWQKFLSVACIPVWLATIVATGSRAGFLALVTAGMVLVTMTRKFKLLAGTALCVIVFLFIAPPQFWDRIRSIDPDTRTMDKSSLTRWHNWQAGLQIMRNHPFTGAGFMKFPKAAVPYLPDDFSGRRGRTFSHNTFVQIGTENGLVTLGFYVVTTLFLIWSLGKKPQDILPESRIYDWVRQGLLAGMFASLVSSFFGDHAGTDFFWWLYGIGFACLCVRQRAQVLAAEKVKPQTQVASRPHTVRPRRKVRPAARSPKTVVAEE